MRYAMTLLVCVCTSARGDDWTPPENPDPQAILKEAQEDTRAKRYETALAKHVWFHENALSIKRSLHGVRLSFALSNWHELGTEYAPALAKLKETRDQAKNNVIEGKDVLRSFFDMTAINRTLEEDVLTKDTFEILDERNPKTAKQVFGLAKPSLVRAKAYVLFVKYVDPKNDFARMVKRYHLEKKWADDPRFGDRLLDFADKKFANDVTTLVAILAINDRKKEAEEIVASAREEWDDSAFHADLEKGLKGAVPEPWP